METVFILRSLTGWKPYLFLYQTLTTSSLFLGQLSNKHSTVGHDTENCFKINDLDSLLQNSKVCSE